VTADRGYGEAGVESDLRDAGVRYVVLPTKGKPSKERRKIESRRAFRKMVRWRTGCEGRISCAKRDFGLGRTRIDDNPPAASDPTRRPRPQRRHDPTQSQHSTEFFRTK